MSDPAICPADPQKCPFSIRWFALKSGTPDARAKKQYLNKIQPECPNFNRKAEDNPSFFRKKNRKYQEEDSNGAPHCLFFYKNIAESMKKQEKPY